jgi:DNA polymerase
VALVQPKVIVVMGRFSTQAVLQSTEPLGKLRGQVHTFQGVPVVVTYHPDALLRNLPDKAKAWADLVLALKVVQG